jgi:tetratricopeptide (TPR) repeat protein
MKNKIILTSILLLVWIFTCMGFELSNQKTEVAHSIMIDIAECKFDRAMIAIDSLISTDSSEPLGWMLSLSCISLQQLDYNSDESDSFQITYSRAKTVMETYEKKNGADSYILTVRGITQMIATAYTMNRKKYWKAMRMGFDALDLCKEAKKIDSTNSDADFVIGLYNYARAELKRKFLGILFWYSGDKHSGIRMIENCTHNAKLIPLVADMVLQEIYVKEGMHEKAGSGIQRLLALYPGSRLLLWTKSKLFETRKMPQQAAQTYRVLADAYEHVPAAKNNYYATRYMEAKRFFEAKNIPSARSACDQLLSACKGKDDDICDDATALSEKLLREEKP